MILRFQELKQWIIGKKKSTLCDYTKASKAIENKDWNKKRPRFKSWPIVKSPQFLSNPHETWWKWLPHEVIIFTKLGTWELNKTVDFSLMAYFWAWVCFLFQTLVTASYCESLNIFLWLHLKDLILYAIKKLAKSSKWTNKIFI